MGIRTSECRLDRLMGLPGDGPAGGGPSSPLKKSGGEGGYSAAGWEMSRLRPPVRPE